MSNSIGNLKNSGLQGNNFPWQLKMLQGQQCACDALQEIVDNTDQVEPLLIQILAAIQNGTDFEAFLVVDGNDVTWLEVRIWNGTTFDPPVYFAVGSNVPGTPAPPISYINPNTYLAQIVSYTSNLVSIEAGTPNALGQTTMANSMPVVIASNQTAIPVNQGTSPWVVGDGGGSITVDGTIAATQSGTWNIAAVTGPVALPTGAATELTLAAVDTKLTSAVRTPGIRTFVNTTGNTLAGWYSFSIANVGSASGLVDGEVLPAGVTINFDGGALNNTLGSMTFDATGTTFVLTWIS
jgi:hypothetical protein